MAEQVDENTVRIKSGRFFHICEIPDGWKYQIRTRPDGTNFVLIADKANSPRIFEDGEWRDL